MSSWCLYSSNIRKDQPATITTTTKDLIKQILYYTEISGGGAKKSRVSYIRKLWMVVILNRLTVVNLIGKVIFKGTWRRFSSVTQSYPILLTPWTAACQASLFITNSCLIKFMSIESHPLSSTSLSFNLSQHQGLFQWISSPGGQRIGVSASASTSVLPMNI